MVEDDVAVLPTACSKCFQNGRQFIGTESVLNVFPRHPILKIIALVPKIGVCQET